MTPGSARSAPSSRRRSAAADFAMDPAKAIVQILARADGALSKREIGARLAEGGVAAGAFEKAWRTAQERVRFDDNVVYERPKYRWTETPREISLEERVYRLTRTPDPSTPAKLMALVRDAMEGAAADPIALADAKRRAADAERRVLALQRRIDELVAAAAVVAAQGPAVAAPGGAADDAHQQYERAERRRLARERQARIDAMSTVAELAAEVEELTAKNAAPEVLLEHTRALTGGRGLEAIGQAGQQIAYRESHHEPVADFPDDGELVTVIRPGYLWHAPGEAVLISKALITRARKGANGR